MSAHERFPPPIPAQVDRGHAESVCRVPVFPRPIRFEAKLLGCATRHIRVLLLNDHPLWAAGAHKTTTGPGDVVGVVHRTTLWIDTACIAASIIQRLSDLTTPDVSETGTCPPSSTASAMGSHSNNRSETPPSERPQTSRPGQPQRPAMSELPSRGKDRRFSRSGEAAHGSNRTKSWLSRAA